MKINSVFIALGILVAVFLSCNKDDDNEPTVKNGKILVSTMLPNPDGMSGSAYIQLMENLEPKSLTNSTAIPIPYSSTPIVCRDDVFILPGFAGVTDIMTKYSRINGELVKQGEYTMPSQSGATNVVTKGDIAYVSCVLLGKIVAINHKTIQIVKEIDLSSYGIGDQNPDPSCMVIRDNLLYVALIQMVGGYYPAPERPYSDVLIVNTDNNEVVKVITDSTSGISYPTRPMDPYTIFMDEKNDIYIVGIGAFGFLPGHKSGLLRIKSGETEFDKSYQFVFNSTTITNEANLSDCIQSVRYAGDNKLYGTANIPAYYSDPINFITDRTVIPVEIDISAKTIKKLAFPYSNSYGTAVGIHESQVVFGLATETSNGFYTYNPTTGEASASAVITTEGYPYSFVSFE